MRAAHALPHIRTVSVIHAMAIAEYAVFNHI